MADRFHRVAGKATVNSSCLEPLTSMTLARPAGAGRAWLAFLSFSVGSVLLMVGVMASTPEPSGSVALVYPPTMSSAEAFLRASSTGGRPIRMGRFDWIVVVAPEPNDPDFAARAHAGGAIAIVNPWIAGGCSQTRSISHPFNQQRSW
jgi:hypothetical protein